MIAHLKLKKLKVSQDPDDLEPLTANHLLTLKRKPVFPPGLFDHNDQYARRRWKQAQYISHRKLFVFDRRLAAFFSSFVTYSFRCLCKINGMSASYPKKHATYNFYLMDQVDLKNEEDISRSRECKFTVRLHLQWVHLKPFSISSSSSSKSFLIINGICIYPPGRNTLAHLRITVSGKTVSSKNIMHKDKTIDTTLWR